MIKFYTLEVKLIDGCHVVNGADVIHHALLLATQWPFIRYCIMEVTSLEHALLEGYATSSRGVTPAEEYQYLLSLEPRSLFPDETLVLDLLSRSPDVIRLPHVWKLLRIFGKRLGYPVED